MIVCERYAEQMVVGFFFTKNGRIGQTKKRRTYSRSSSPSLSLIPPFFIPLEVRPFVEIDIDTGHWNLIHSADEPKLERVFGGKIERSMLRTLFFRRRENFTFERKEGRNRTIPREKFCRPLERIIERACSSPPRTNRRDTILSVRRPMQLVSSNPRETGVPYIYIGSSSVRFPIFNGGRVAFVLPPPSATVHCFLYMEMPRNRIRSRWVSFVWYAFIFYFRF